MRLTLLAMGLAIAAGCKPPPPATIEAAFRREVKFYFNNLNQDGLERKAALAAEQAMAQRNPALQAPTGTIYSTYLFDDQGFIVENFHCQICGAKLLLPFPSAQYLCPSCGHCPYKIGHPKTNLLKSPCEICTERATGIPREPVEAQKKENFKGFEGTAVKDMFEITDTKKDRGYMQAVVRYVRRVWAYDEQASVLVPQKALDRAQVDRSWLPAPGEEGGRRPGFHRPDSLYVGEITFDFQGGELTVRSGPREEPVRPWTDLLGSKN